MNEELVFPLLEEWLVRLTEFVVPLINIIALVLITWGVLHSVAQVVRVVLTRDKHAFRTVWMDLSRWLVAGLTFQLAADIIETSAAPTWDDIGKLAAIAAIRTFLNYFLERDITEMEEKRREERQGTEATGF